MGGVSESGFARRCTMSMMFAFWLGLTRQATTESQIRPKSINMWLMWGSLRMNSNASPVTTNANSPSPVSVSTKPAGQSELGSGSVDHVCGGGGTTQRHTTLGEHGDTCDAAAYEEQPRVHTCGGRWCHGCLGGRPRGQIYVLPPSPTRSSGQSMYRSTLTSSATPRFAGLRW